MYTDKTRAVKNKDIAIKLAYQGFEILNVTRSRDDSTRVVYIFADTDDFRKAFDKIVSELPKRKGSCDLSDFERKYLVEMLQAKQAEYKGLGVKTDTIDGIIGKLDMSFNEGKEGKL